jgi:hypothetical protein
MSMKKKGAESELEFLETSKEAKAAGLRRIKRRHYTCPPEMLPSEEMVSIEVSLAPEVANFVQNDPRRINQILESAMRKESVARTLLDDEEFIDGIKKKLAV